MEAGEEDGVNATVVDICDEGLLGGISIVHAPEERVPPVCGLVLLAVEVLGDQFDDVTFDLCVSWGFIFFAGEQEDAANVFSEVIVDVLAVVVTEDADAYVPVVLHGYVIYSDEDVTEVI